MSGRLSKSNFNIFFLSTNEKQKGTNTQIDANFDKMHDALCLTAKWIGNRPWTFVCRISELLLIKSSTTFSWSEIEWWINWNDQLVITYRTGFATIYRYKWHILEVNHSLIYKRDKSFSYSQWLPRFLSFFFANFHSHIIFKGRWINYDQASINY